MAEDDEPNTLVRSITRPIVPALGVGTATGIARLCKKALCMLLTFGTGILGAAYGGVAGTLILTPRPLLYTTMSGVQWFCAGTTYFCLYYLQGCSQEADRS
jgi:hypothetical protein